jgi:hypothetical protein
MERGSIFHAIAYQSSKDCGCHAGTSVVMLPMKSIRDERSPAGKSNDAAGVAESPSAERKVGEIYGAVP